MKKIVLIFFLMASLKIYGQILFIPLADEYAYAKIDNLVNSGKISLKYLGSKPYKTSLVYQSLDQNSIFAKYLEANYFSPNSLMKFKDADYRLKSGASLFGEGYFVEQFRQNFDLDEIHQLITEGGFQGFINYDSKFYLNLKASQKIRWNRDISLRGEYATKSRINSGEESFNSEDYLEGVIGFADDELFFDVNYGYYPFSLGYAKLNPIILRNTGDNFDLLNCNFRVSNFRFQTFSASLSPDSETRMEFTDSLIANGGNDFAIRHNKREKYLAAHRLEYAFNDNFRLGVGETIISGDRSLEMGYFIPIFPLFWLEHLYGDFDNAAVFFDLYYKPINNLSFYSEIYIDDESFTQGLLTNYTNKFSVLLGGYYSNLFLDNLNFRFELTRTEPFVYTHKFHINRYMHHDQYLGSKYGPDSESFSFALDYLFREKFLIIALFERGNVGQPLAGQEDFPDNYNDNDKIFLNGIVEKNRFYSLSLRYNYSNDIYLKLYYSHREVQNKNHLRGKYEIDNSLGMHINVILRRLDFWRMK